MIAGPGAARASEKSKLSPDQPVSPEIILELEKRLGKNKWARGKFCNLVVERRTLEKKFIAGNRSELVLFLELENGPVNAKKAQILFTSEATWNSTLITDALLGHVCP